MKAERQIGDLVIPKDYPELKSRVKEISNDFFTGETLYILENGTAYTKDELI